LKKLLKLNLTGRRNIVITEANRNSRENNPGGRLGCLKCSYGPGSKGNVATKRLSIHSDDSFADA